MTDNSESDKPRKPWEEQGISKAAYYQRKSRERRAQEALAKQQAKPFKPRRKPKHPGKPLRGSEPTGYRSTGREAYTPTDKDRAYVRAMVITNQPHAEIAAVIGIAEATLRKHFADDLKHGRSKANAMVVANYFRQVTKDDFRSMPGAQFWMRVIMGMRDPDGSGGDLDEHGNRVMRVMVINPPEAGLEHLKTEPGASGAIEISGHGDPFSALDDPDK